MPLIDKREDEVLNLGLISLLTISSILECRIVKNYPKILCSSNLMKFLLPKVLLMAFILISASKSVHKPFNVH